MSRPLERRHAVRMAVEMPLEFDGGAGVTRDVSVSGVYFFTNRRFEIGSSFAFALVFDAGSRPARVKCRGVVVRAEIVQETTGVAVMIESLGSC